MRLPRRSEPWVFQTKTTSTARDLFYQYNALRHFHDANVAKAAGDAAPHSRDYIELQALKSRAILPQTNSRPRARTSGISNVRRN